MDSHKYELITMSLTSGIATLSYEISIFVYFLPVNIAGDLCYFAIF